MSFVRFDAVFEHLPNPFMVIDRQFRYVACNAAYLRMTGVPRDALLGQDLFTLFPPEPGHPNDVCIGLLRAGLERVLATGMPEVLERLVYYLPKSANGLRERRLWSCRLTPILDASGAVEVIVQESLEATALDTELQHLQQLFAQAPGFMCFLRGPEHVFEIMNESYRQLMGHRDLIGVSVRAALPELVSQGYLELLDSVFTSGEAFIGNGFPIQLRRTRNAPLEERILDFVYQPIRDTAGEILGIFVEGQDVTDKYLTSARQKFLIEALPNQVWTADPEGKLDFISERAITYFGRSEERILGDGWLDLVHPDDVAACVRRWSHSLATGEAYEVEFRLLRVDGQFRWHLGRANAELDSTGRIRRWFGTNTDVHEARVAVAELRARSEYEQRLIGIVSHDLRNPLGAIVLAATLLKNLALPPQVATTLARLHRSAERATRLISDLLDFAKARIGSTIPIAPRVSNLREIVAEVVDEMQLIAPQRVVVVHHTGEETGSWDADRLAQVIANIVGNALQHGPAGVPIVIDSRIDARGVVLTVKNEGAPIPAADLATLFEPFQRGTAAGPQRGSLGLGLYIAREVVVAHGGTIEVASDAATGTCFTVRLPRVTI